MWHTHRTSRSYWPSFLKIYYIPWKYIQETDINRHIHHTKVCFTTLLQKLYFCRSDQKSFQFSPKYGIVDSITCFILLNRIRFFINSNYYPQRKIRKITWPYNTNNSISGSTSYMLLPRKKSSVIQTTKCSNSQVWISLTFLEIKGLPQRNHSDLRAAGIKFDAWSRVWSKNIFYTIALFSDSLLENLSESINS